MCLRGGEVYVRAGEVYVRAGEVYVRIGEEYVRAGEVCVHPGEVCVRACTGSVRVGCWTQVFAFLLCVCASVVFVLVCIIPFACCFSFLFCSRLICNVLASLSSYVVPCLFFGACITFTFFCMSFAVFVPSLLVLASPLLGACVCVHVCVLS